MGMQSYLDTVQQSACIFFKYIVFLTVLSPQKAADNTEIEEKILSLLSSLHQKLTKVTRSQHFSRLKQARAFGLTRFLVCPTIAALAVCCCCCCCCCCYLNLKAQFPLCSPVSKSSSQTVKWSPPASCRLMMMVAVMMEVEVEMVEMIMLMMMMMRRRKMMEMMIMMNKSSSQTVKWSLPASCRLIANHPLIFFKKNK